MPEFLPFAGSRFNKSKVDLAKVTAPPFDVISSEYRDILYARDEHNIVRVDLNREKDPYQAAAKIWKQFHLDDIVRQDDTAAFYVYYQTFLTPSGKQITREGVIGKLRLSPYADKQVMPHERTLSAPREDRLRLMEATDCNLSPIFGLISDASLVFDQTLEIATVRPPIADVNELLPNGETVRHLVWRLEDQVAMSRITKLVAGNSVIIADGHHRYETALEYHRLHPESKEANYIMIFLANLQAEGAVILPTHRLVHGLDAFDQYSFLDKLKAKFELYPFDTREEALALLDRENRALAMLEFSAAPNFVVIADLQSIPRDSSVETIAAYRLQEEILKPMLGITQRAIDEKRNLLYPHTMKEVDEMKEMQTIDVAFILKPVRPAEIEAVVKQGEYMPQKSTFFYPKLLTGLVFHEF